jgi:hypothetical protein
MNNQHSGIQIPDGINQVDQELVKKKRKFEQLMMEFDQMLKDKTLAKNKGRSQVNMETGRVEQLLAAAYDLDVSQDAPEGSYGLIVLALREGLLMRDAINELEWRILQAEKENKTLKRLIDDHRRATSGQETK